MDAIYKLATNNAYYKCLDCGNIIMKTQTKARLFPATFIKECPNLKCASHSRKNLTVLDGDTMRESEE